MPRANFNVGGQDTLLIDNNTSYFQNLGYTRSSNHQIEYRYIDPISTP